MRGDPPGQPWLRRGAGQNLAEQFGPARADVHQIDPPGMAKPGVDVAQQIEDRRGVPWGDMHGGTEVARWRFAPGIEPAGAVQGGLHGLTPGHPHAAEPSVVR